MLYFTKILVYDGRKNVNNRHYKAEILKNNIFGFHIHDGTSCTGYSSDTFSNAGSHYNPNNCPHPAHAGDLPPLFGNDGYAYMSMLTDRFTVNEIIGKVAIIHDKPDDFTTQPAGDSGNKIACGEIVPL